MMLSKLKTLALSGVLIATGAAAEALPPIGTDKFVHDQLLAGFIGDKIAKECDTIGARKLLAVRKLFALRDYAREKGYTDEVIKAYVDDKAEKAKFRAEAEAYLDAKGAKADDAASYCMVGMTEIKSGSLTGKLLFSK